MFLSSLFAVAAVVVVVDVVSVSPHHHQRRWSGSTLSTSASPKTSRKCSKR
jgi:hypothetical protein